MTVFDKKIFPHIFFMYGLFVTGPDPLENYKATKPAFNIGPVSAHQRNAIWQAGR